MANEGNVTIGMQIFEDVLEYFKIEGGTLESSILLFVLIMATSFIVAALITFIIDRYVKRLTGMTKSDIDD